MTEVLDCFTFNKIKTKQTLSRFFPLQMLSLLNLAFEPHVHCSQLRDPLHCMSVIAVHVTCHCSYMFIVLLILSYSPNGDYAIQTSTSNLSIVEFQVI